MRAEEPLNEAEQKVHLEGAVTILRELHDAIDVEVARAYGWPVELEAEAILEQLVALNATRAAEERDGKIRWLRPAFQNPGSVPTETQTTLAIEAREPVEQEVTVKEAWPKPLADRTSVTLKLLRRSPSGLTLQQVAQSFKGARAKDVEAVLDTLAALGHLVAFESPDGKRWASPG